jgi:oligoendopeptidase F
MAESAPDPITWDLTDVLPAREGPELQAFLDDLEERVEALEDERPRLEDVDSPETVADLFDRYAEIREACARLGAYGRLAFSTDTSDGEIKAFMSRTDERTTAISNRIRFLELWWKNLEDEEAEALLPEDPDLRHHLRRLRTFAPHTLSEAEERVVAIKDDTGATAMNRLRDIVTSGFRFEDPVTGEPVSEGRIKRRMYHPDAEVREAAYDELWRVYGEHESELTFLYQTVVQDWANEQLNLRDYGSPIEPRNRYNDVATDTVETLLEVCRDNRDIWQRYFTWKGEQLGLEPMSRYHIYAPLEAEEPQVDWTEAREGVLETMEGFSGTMAEAARSVFEADHLHVFPDEHKRSGAYCSTPTHDTTPYVFLNYTEDASSVKTLAHELGHAVHSVLASDRHPLAASAPLPLAETASVFSEMLLHDRLVDQADPEEQQALLSDKVHEIYASVGRQAYFTIFEQQAHEALGEGATPDELHDLYVETLEEQFGPLEVPDDFAREWTYVPHFFHTPFYTYAYSFGTLLSLALYGMYRDRGEAFRDDYEDLLALGGSRSPREAVRSTVGVDIAKRSFWQRGFDVVEDMVSDLEAA